MHATLLLAVEVRAVLFYSTYQLLSSVVSVELSVSWNELLLLVLTKQ